MEWICREKCFWRDTTHMPGDIVDIGDKYKKWELNGGVWLPAGTEQVDPSDNIVIPWYFEPVDHSCLVDKKHIHLARDHVKTERTWKYLTEIAKEAAGNMDMDKLPEPEPLTPDALKKLKSNPDALKTKNVRPLTEEEVKKAKKPEPEPKPELTKDEPRKKTKAELDPVVDLINFRPPIQRTPKDKDDD